MHIIDFRISTEHPGDADGNCEQPHVQGLCELINFPSMQPQSLAEVVEELNRYMW